MDKFEQRLEQAARAAWLSYVGGRTQDEIATQLGVSRLVYSVYWHSRGRNDWSRSALIIQ